MAREASTQILLDGVLFSIVQAIRRGRRIYDNIKKAVAYTVAIHVPIAGLSMAPVFIAGLPNPCCSLRTSFFLSVSLTLPVSLSSSPRG
jgi:magnesium-transporting ATPase (P-type)